MNDTISKIYFPALCNWREIINIRVEHNYTQTFNYLMKTKVVLLSADGIVVDNFMLPVAEKTFKKRFHFNASGHVLSKMKVNMIDVVCDA